MSYMKKNEQFEGKYWFKKALGINPKNQEALIALGKIALFQKDSDREEKASNYFLKCLEVNPNNKMALFEMGNLSFLRV